MNHVHWWLFGLSFVTGLVLTFALLGRPVESRARVADSARSESEPPTTKIPVANESPTTKIPTAGDLPTTKIPVTTDAPTTKIAVAKESPTRKMPVPRHAPYGPGSARAAPDGGGPAGWLVKGRSDTRLYYTPDDPTYDPTIAEVWFKDEKSARAGRFHAMAQEFEEPVSSSAASWGRGGAARAAHRPAGCFPAKLSRRAAGPAGPPTPAPGPTPNARPSTRGRTARTPLGAHLRARRCHCRRRLFPLRRAS